MIFSIHYTLHIHYTTYAPTQTFPLLYFDIYSFNSIYTTYAIIKPLSCFKIIFSKRYFIMIFSTNYTLHTPYTTYPPTQTFPYLYFRYLSTTTPSTYTTIYITSRFTHRHSKTQSYLYPTICLYHYHIHMKLFLTLCFIYIKNIITHHINSANS
jgi:hypothetical protein